MIDKIINHDVNTNKNRTTYTESFQNFNLNASVNSDGINSIPFHLNNTKKDSNEKATDNFGKSIVKFTLFTTSCFFIALQGAPRKLRSKVNQAEKNLIDKNEQLQKGTEKGIKFHVREGAKKLASYSKIIFNLAPLKDVLLAKAMQKTKFTSKISEKITNWFERISFNKVNQSYINTQKVLGTFFADCDKFNSKIPEQQAKRINRKINQIQKLYPEFFGERALRKRLTEIKNEFDGYDSTGKIKVGDSLRDQVYHGTYQNFKEFINKTKNSSIKFISEELSTESKIRNANKVNRYKFIISNSLNSMCEDCFDLLIHIDTFIDPTDQDIRNIIKNISSRLKNDGRVINNKKKILRILPGQATLQKKLEQLDEEFKKSTKYNPKITKEVSNSIKLILSRLNNSNRGEINEILDIYRQSLTDDEFAKILKSGYNAADSLEKSVDLETNKLFDKIRDLKIGSAPKDVLLLLIPIGAVAYELTKADSNEEKVSVGVKYGIPVIGAVSVTMYCTAALMSAGPSLIVGFLSGLALNQLGIIGYNLIKKHSHNNHENI